MLFCRLGAADITATTKSAPLIILPPPREIPRHRRAEVGGGGSTQTIRTTYLFRSWTKPCVT